MQHKQLIRHSLVALVLMAVMPGAASAQTLERIKGTGTLTIGVVPDEAPFSTAQGTGYSVDLCDKVAEQLRGLPGLSDLKVEQKSGTLEEGLQRVENSQIDLLCGAATDTLERRQRVSFSIPIYNSGVGAILRKNAPPDLIRVLEGKVAHEGPIWRATINRGLSEHTYAVHQGTVTEAWVRERIATLGVIAKVVTVKDHEEGIDLVARGQADTYFADRAILRELLAARADSDELMLLDRYFTYEPLALVMARNNDDFRLIVDTALSALYRSDGFPAFYAQYFGDPGDLTLRLFKIYARR